MAPYQYVYVMKDLTKSYPGGREVFKGITLSFLPGVKIGVLGVNGAGKSTLLKIMAGIDKEYGGEAWAAEGVKVGYLEQEPQLDPKLTVGENVAQGFGDLKKAVDRFNEISMRFAEPMEDDEMNALLAEQADLQEKIDAGDGWELDRKLEIALDALRCPPADSPVDKLSGGERRRVALCRLLLEKPDILMLDEPTNYLDRKAISWLEEFLIEFEGTVIVVSHDRHFLNKVCTHMVDIDFGKIKLYTGNYDFWYESSQLALQMMRNQNKKKEEKVKELQEFIARFSANASKSKQATSRKKLLEKISLDEIQPSTRRYPFISFQMEREVGNEILTVDNLTKTIDGVNVLNNISFRVNRGDKIAFVGENDIANTTLLKILAGEMEQDSGSFKWGVTITTSYFPSDNSKYFNDVDLNLVDWMRQFSEEKSESFLRGFLGRMLFSGEEALKQAKVLSGGEKVRCMLSKMMLKNANVLMLDQPTNHLDLESITALNNGLKDYKSNILFTSHDYQFVQTIANRIIEITPTGLIDKNMTYDEYLETM